MEKHRIKRLPVVRDKQLVGIVSRANLLHALASLGADRARNSRKRRDHSHEFAGGA